MVPGRRKQDAVGGRAAGDVPAGSTPHSLAVVPVGRSAGSGSGAHQQRGQPSDRLGRSGIRGHPCGWIREKSPGGDGWRAGVGWFLGSGYRTRPEIGSGGRSHHAVAKATMLRSIGLGAGWALHRLRVLRTPARGGTGQAGPVSRKTSSADETGKPVGGETGMKPVGERRERSPSEWCQATRCWRTSFSWILRNWLAALSWATSMAA